MDDSLLAPVIEAIRAGHLDEAEDACRKVAVENSESPDPVHFLGVIASQRGQFSEAIAFYHQAIRLNPSQPSFYTNLGSALYSSGSFNEAIEAFQKAIALQPENPIAHNNLANLLREEGRLAEAESSYLEALRLMPDYPDALNNIGIVLGELGRPDEAIAHYERALAISPNSAEIYNLLGNVLLAGGRPGEAEAGFRRAIELNPDYADAHEGRATAIAAQGRPEEAEFSYLEAIRLNPENTTANLNLAGMYLKYGDSDRALSVYERLILLQPEVVGAHLGKSRALSALCRDGEAVDSIRHAAGLDPENEMLVLASEVYCPALMEGTDEIERRREEIDEALGRRTPGSILLNPDEILRWGTEPSFYLAYHGKNDLAIRSKYADLFRVDDLAEPKGSGEEIYRIGFVVTERHEGIFLSFMEGILKNMFDDRLEVNVICVEGSRKIISEKMGGSKMRYHVISQKFESALREIRAGRYDLLFYFEVGTDSFNYFLPFFRLAPVQCTSWGYPVTSGISQIDYFISSHLVESEDAEEHYRERLECLNALPAYYYRPKAPARPGSRTDFAISESENVYLCSQSLFKIHPDYDKVLANILRSDPVGQVVMIEGKHPNWHRCMQARFRENIPDVAGRVRFVPQMSRDDYLRLITMSDVMLDPFPFGSGNSAYESIAMGTPVVTLPGEFMRGRVTSGCYSKIEVLDCVASSPEEYVDIALRVGREADFREVVKDKILNENAMLFEDDSAVRELEGFFIRAVEAVRP